MKLSSYFTRRTKFLVVFWQEVNRKRYFRHYWLKHLLSSFAWWLLSPIFSSLQNIFKISISSEKLFFLKNNLVDLILAFFFTRNLATLVWFWRIAIARGVTPSWLCTGFKFVPFSSNFSTKYFTTGKCPSWLLIYKEE